MPSGGYNRHSGWQAWQCYVLFQCGHLTDLNSTDRGMPCWVMLVMSQWQLPVYTHTIKISVVYFLLLLELYHTLQFVPPFVLTEFNKWVQLPVYCHKSEFKVYRWAPPQSSSLSSYSTICSYGFISHHLFIHFIFENKVLGEVSSIQRFHLFLETWQAVRSFMNVAVSKRLDVDEMAVWLSHWSPDVVTCFRLMTL